MRRSSVIKLIENTLGRCKDCGCVVNIENMKYHKKWHELNKHKSADGLYDKTDWLVRLNGHS
jgi:transcription initiation factor TFIIIB Brf1 subunit/transcription initiation factor TFIIB